MNIDRVLLLIPLLALLSACASTDTAKKTTDAPTPDEEITATNRRNQPNPIDPYAGTPYEGTAAPISSNTQAQNNDLPPLPSDQDPTYNPNSPIYPDPDESSRFTTMPSSGRYHTVEPGDTLWKIAREYGTNVRTLRAINGFDSNVTIIRPGDKIKLP